jgi:hypothetical protein
MSHEEVLDLLSLADIAVVLPLVIALETLCSQNKETGNVHLFYS